MGKDIIIESLSTPDRLGYNDKIAIIKDDQSTAFHCQCSACPNPYRASDGAQWKDVYGWIACNDKLHAYTWECTTTPKHGKCLSINDGGAVPTRFIDKNNGKAEAYSVLIHCGYNDTWRGSAACCTLPPLIWPTFIAFFELNETGNLYVLDYSNMAEGVTV
jgi:hypothetical protein